MIVINKAIAVIKMKGYFLIKGLNSVKIYKFSIFITWDWRFNVVHKDKGIIKINNVIDSQLADMKLGVEGSKIENKLVIIFS